jgi:hypothetical protein
MKIWYGYGSEHSMNLVMIGHFKDAEDAVQAKKVIDLLTNQVNADIEADQLQVGERADRITDGMRELLRRLDMFIIGSTEMEQFAYDVSVKVENQNQLVIKTDEADISAFLKVLIDKGARVEVFSAHHYPGTERDN